MINRYKLLLDELKNRSAETTTTRNSRVLIVDGLNTFLRGYAASPTTNSDGIHVGGISGTLMSIGAAIKEVNPTRVIVVFDGKNGSARRRELYSEYKANRKFKIRLNRAETVEKEDNQLYQLVRLVEYFEVLPFTVVMMDRAEADDVIAYIAQECLKDSQTFIMSADKDFYQLVSNEIHIWSPTKKKLYYTEDVYDQYKIMPENFVIFRSLIGDSGDNIPGVKGVAEKSLIKNFPIITSKEKITLDQFFDSVRAQVNGKKTPKIVQKVLEAEADVRLYYDIMQLSDSMIDTTTKLKVVDLVREPVDRLNKIAFHKLLIEDKMSTAIRNVEMWLKDTTQKLDYYCLQD